MCDEKSKEREILLEEIEALEKEIDYHVGVQNDATDERIANSISKDEEKTIVDTAEVLINDLEKDLEQANAKLSELDNEDD